MKRVDGGEKPTGGKIKGRGSRGCCLGRRLGRLRAGRAILSWNAA